MLDFVTPDDGRTRSCSASSTSWVSPTVPRVRPSLYRRRPCSSATTSPADKRLEAAARRPSRSHGARRCPTSRPWSRGRDRRRNQPTGAPPRPPALPSASCGSPAGSPMGRGSTRCYAGAPGVLVNPSAREDLGLVVAEAAAQATPSVVVAGEDNAAAELVARRRERLRCGIRRDSEVLGAAIARAVAWAATRCAGRRGRDVVRPRASRERSLATVGGRLPVDRWRASQPPLTAVGGKRLEQRTRAWRRRCPDFLERRGTREAGPATSARRYGRVRRAAPTDRSRRWRRDRADPRRRRRRRATSRSTGRSDTNHGTSRAPSPRAGAGRSPRSGSGRRAPSTPAYSRFELVAAQPCRAGRTGSPRPRRSTVGASGSSPWLPVMVEAGAFARDRCEASASSSALEALVRASGCRPARSSASRRPRTDARRGRWT